MNLKEIKMRMNLIEDKFKQFGNRLM